MALVTPRTPLTSSTTPSTPTSPRSSSRNLYGYQPLCFHKEIFSSPSFNVDGFISDCRKRVPLESVRTDLREYSSSLENELVELINKDYTDFVNLSSHLVGIDEVLNELKEPLGKIKDEATVLNNRVQTVIEATETKMKEKQDIIIRKQYLRLFINMSNSVEKLEHLLGENVVQSSLLPDVAVYIDRIGNEYNMLRFYLSYSQNFSASKEFSDKFSQKIETLTIGMEKEVSKHFRNTISKGNFAEQGERGGEGKKPSPFAQVVSACLRVFSALNKVSSAYDIYREIVVKPRVGQIVTATNLGSRGTCEGLKGIFDSLLAFVSDQCCPFFADAAAEYDFLSNSVWVEIEDTMQSRIGRIYNPGIPEIFLQNYKASFTFLSKLEAIGCTTTEQLQSFRAHPSYAAFEKRWHTSVYHQLRFTEIAGKVEVALSQLQQQTNNQPADAKQDKTEPQFSLLGSTVMWQELHRMWSDNVFIFKLTSQFVKLTIQLLSRYSSWIAAAYKSSSEIPKAPGDTSETPVTGVVDEQAAAIWSKLVPGAYALIYHDLTTLVANVQGKFMQHVLEAIAQEGVPPQPLVDMVRDVISTSAAALLVHKAPLSNCVTSHLTKKAIDSLQPLLGVTATYRLTDKRVPTRANYYVDDVVAVLDTFKTSHDSVIPSSALKEWELTVLEEVTSKYEGMVTETVKGAQKALATLNRMVKKKGQTTTSGLTDIDKISLQLYLDVTRYGELLKSKLNIDPNTFPPFLSLLAKVSDGEKFKNLVSSS